MAIAKGTAKVVAYKKETTWGEVVDPASGKQLRRVTAAFNLIKDAYESAEIRTDRQVADYRHGIRSAEGSLNGELSAGSYSDFMQSLVAKNFAAVSLTAVSCTITVNAGPPTSNTITRSGGSFITDGFRVGMVIRGSGYTATADATRNLLVLEVDALTMKVKSLDGTDLTAQGSAASVTFTAPGKRTHVPTGETGDTTFTDDSYTVEEWYSDIAQSEVYTGMKVGSMAVSLPSTGLATVDFSFMGKNLTQTGTSQFFTAATLAAQGTTGIFAAVNGVMMVGGAPVALITSADFTVERALENATAVGSNSIAEVFTGRIRVTGNLSVYFQDATFRNYFNAETEVALALALTATSAKNSDFIAFCMPRVKLGSFTKDDGELGIVASTSFQALKATAAGSTATTIAIQDSTLS